MADRKPPMRRGRPIRSTATVAGSFTDSSSTVRPIHEFVEDTCEVIDRDGILCCSCLKYIESEWCNHVQEVVVKFWDAMPNRDDVKTAHTAFVRYAPQMRIPMFPTKDVGSNRWQVVLIGEVEGDGSRAVRLVDVIGPTKDPELLGWIFPGEGVSAIRNLVVEWVRAHYHSAPACKSPVHSRVEWSKADNRESELGERDLVDLFSLVKTGECASCHRFSDASADAPDL